MILHDVCFGNRPGSLGPDAKKYGTFFVKLSRSFPLLSISVKGGAGAGPTWVGRSGVHTHCTNTRITDPEILERRYPVLLRRFGLRAGSGGAGMNKGGDGVIREIEPLRPLVMSILSERRTLRPYGLEGGEPGMTGRNLLIKEGGIALNIGAKRSCNINVGERLVIESPGGGGYGVSP